MLRIRHQSWCPLCRIKEWNLLLTTISWLTVVISHCGQWDTIRKWNYINAIRQTDHKKKTCFTFCFMYLCNTLFVERTIWSLTTKLYDKRNDFNFPIVKINYPFLDSNIPSSAAYGVYMSQLIRYSRTCNSYRDFLHRSVLLIKKLLSQGFIETRLISTLKRGFGRYHHLTLPYRVSVTTMANDIYRPWYCCHE